MDPLEYPAEQTLFGGVLRRLADGRYVWADGSDWTHLFRPETIDNYNFRISLNHVEVPRRSAKANPDLAWCEDVAVKPHPVWARKNIWLVPLLEWDKRRKVPIGVTWDNQDGPAILDKAQDLGWTWPGKMQRGVDAANGEKEVSITEFAGT